MLNPSPDDYRRELDKLSLRLETLENDFRKCGMFSGTYQAFFDRIQEKKGRLAAKLVERTGMDSDIFKDEFGGDWNSFIEDLELLELRLLDAKIRLEQNAASTTGQPAGS
ncbi:MAG TPA: hypothetical protein VMT22_01770 [Terriglobales bacterium]|nr:hypothetical protein [Terriglobales bacterium]